MKTYAHTDRIPGLPDHRVLFARSLGHRHWRIQSLSLAEQKRVALERFEAVFSLEPKESTELVGSAVHLLGAPQVIDAQLQGLADKNKNCFTQEQADSMVQLMVEVVSADGEVTAAQSAFIENMRTHFEPPQKKQGTWS